jgi:BA14K-like protein
LDFASVAITLISGKAIKENEMHKLNVLTAAAALVFVTPVSAQEMGGATGPGSARGLEPTYNNSYYNSYDQGEEFWPAQIGGGALEGNNSYSMSPDDGHCRQRYPQRYRSYESASGTYTGYDGRRHSCR